MSNYNIEWDRDEIDHIATGGESLREFAENAGMDNQDTEWLLDDRDVWVKNPYYTGPEGRHPEDDRYDDAIGRELPEWATIDSREFCWMQNA